MKPLSFFKGWSHLLVLNLLVKPVWIFCIDREIQNQVGYESYGTYFAVFNLSYILSFIADAGLSNMLNQKLAALQQISTGQFIKTKLLLSLVYIALVYMVAVISGLEQWTIFFYVVGIQLFTSWFIFLRSIITAQQYFTTDAWFSVIDKLLVILLCAGFLYYPVTFGKINLFIFLKIQLIATGIGVAIALLFVLHKRLQLKGDKTKFFSVIQSALPFAAIILLMSIHYRADGFLLERMHTNGAYEAGRYALGYRLLDAGNMVGYLSASFLVPFIARNLQQKNLIQEAITNVRHGLIFFGIGIACFAALYSSWIQQQLYHTDNDYNSRLIQLCLAVLPAYLMMHVYGSALTAIAKFRPLISILVFSVFINLLLNGLLIPMYGALGCCIAALVSQYTCALACYVAATKSLKLTVIKKSALLYLGITIGLSLFFYFARTTMLNVWLILGLAFSLMIILLATQMTYLKKYFIQLR